MLVRDRLNIYVIYIAILLLLPCSLYGQGDARNRLERLRAEVDSLSKVLEIQLKGEKNLADEIGALDQQIATRQKLISEIQLQVKNEQKAVKRYITVIQDEEYALTKARSRLSVLDGEVVNLTDLIKRRAVFIYKKGMRESLRFLLAANNPGDFFRRQIYVKRIQERDARNLTNLRKKRSAQDRQRLEIKDHIAELNLAKLNREKAVERAARLLDEENSERSSLVSNKKQIESKLVEVRNDTEELKKLIAERERAAREVADMIASLESRRVTGQTQELILGPRHGMEVVIRAVPVFATFGKARGALPWPVKGRVVRSFGLQKNKLTGTLTESPGIDIAVPEDTEVLAVQGGICTKIAYLRGYGNTALIHHGDGYYTVYAHLGEMLIREQEQVEAGRVIGTVGTTTQSDEPILHFEVWHKASKQDPLAWLG
ncbi:peptidoglycan DD-metalloendopeptidase family protein [bacterium]|nr:peptidoglycan DD-metalloendopeptidase family protein [bacterium]